MFVDVQVGALTEPLTGRRWEPSEIRRQLLQRLAIYQHQGMRAGDRVLFLYGNRLEFFVDVLAVWSLGACVVPIDVRLTPFEIETLARAARPQFALVAEEIDTVLADRLTALGVKLLESTESTPPTRATPSLSGMHPSLDGDALILFTSGTTGQPKGVVHTHRSLRARWIALRQHLGLKAYRRTLCLLPTHFGHGLICNCLFPWLWGQELFILPPFRADLVMQLGAIVDEFEITFMSSVPALWRLALKTARPPRSGTLERVFCGSAPLSAHLWEHIREWTGTKSVFNAYGITETGSWVAGTTMPEFTPADGLIGEPWGALVKILKSRSTDEPPWAVPGCAPNEPGYVWLNTPALMRGYWERDDLTRQVVSQGWFMTGDIGIIDDRGWLYLRGREREEINKGGMKIYPGDIDAVVERFAATVDVCCFGYDDPLYGQNVGLALVLSDSSDETLRRLYQWLKQHLAEHQMPMRWYLLEAIPRTSRGKMNRARVAEVCARLEPVNVHQLFGERR
ncbi:MAG: long-chain fatty acid--CoA ligase [Acidobacteria bacterium]|nr:MAG: long-chain fatty acid--CoA ligase [Acidobacteriota bacterium]